MKPPTKIENRPMTTVFPAVPTLSPLPSPHIFCLVAFTTKRLVLNFNQLFNPLHQVDHLKEQRIRPF